LYFATEEGVLFALSWHFLSKGILSLFQHLSAAKQLHLLWSKTTFGHWINLNHWGRWL